MKHGQSMDSTGKAVREKAKLLCCGHLHGRKLDTDCEFDTGSDEVSFLPRTLSDTSNCSVMADNHVFK